MQIRVLFFGMLKDVVGRAEEAFELEPGSDVARLFEIYLGRYPELERHRASLLFSRNREFVAQSQRLEEGDEVAFLPPVSGGSSRVTELSQQSEQTRLIFRLTREPIDTSALVRELQRGEDGAVVVFEGVARNHSKGRPTRFLEYEAYEPMALEKMREVGEELAQQFSIDRVGMIHRLGHLEIGEASVVIVVTSEHRKAAFDACREAIDRLKRVVPIWKKEYFADGAVWVEGEGSQSSSPTL
ncbi:MAG: molybdenum cofactor biosynthesis protein MoaE [Acidobacteria bacterium]|nr:molybdenum cofactor biosynthesis protein MoaE [Acidobacteriota bacterium]